MPVLLWILAPLVMGAIGAAVSFVVGGAVASGFMHYFQQMVAVCQECNIVGTSYYLFLNIGQLVYQQFATQVSGPFYLLFALFVLWSASQLVAPVLSSGGQPGRVLLRRVVLGFVVAGLVSSTGAQAFADWIVTPVVNMGLGGSAFAMNKIETGFAVGGSFSSVTGGSGSYSGKGYSIPGCDGSTSESFQFAYMAGGTVPSGSTSTSTSAPSIGHFLCGIARVHTVSSMVVALGGSMVTLGKCNADGSGTSGDTNWIVDMILRCVFGVFLIALYMVLTFMIGFHAINPLTKLVYAIGLMPIALMASIWPKLDSVAKRLLSTIFSAGLQYLILGVTLGTIGVLISAIPQVTAGGTGGALAANSNLDAVIDFFWNTANCSQTLEPLSSQYFYLIFVGLVGSGMLAKTGSIAESLLQAIGTGDIASDAGRKMTEKGGSLVGQGIGVGSGAGSALSKAGSVGVLAKFK